MASKRNPCKECVCFYCRWIGTDNCREDVLKPCYKCGETNCSKKPMPMCKSFCRKGDMI